MFARKAGEKVMIVVAVALVLAVLGACAAPSPMVDTKGKDPAKYQQDLAECQAYAEQTYGAGTGAAAGAVGGVLLGEGIARTAGGMNQRGHLAGAGALLGAVSGAGQGARNQRQVVQRCLAGRGYNVLN